MSRYFFNSGLYETVFYSKHEIDFYTDHRACEEVEYDHELLAEYYKDRLYYEYSEDNDNWEQEIYEIFWDNLSYWSTYFQPLVFNEEIALECGLTPFTYKKIDMLALSGCGMDFSPRLDSYQALSHNSIDKHSRFFSSANECDKYFEYVVGEAVTKKVLQAISSSKY